jgi:hypothetical protein
VHQKTADDFASKAQTPESAEEHETDVSSLAFPDLTQVANSYKTCVVLKPRGPILSGSVENVSQQEPNDGGRLGRSGVWRTVPESHHLPIAACCEQFLRIQCHKGLENQPFSAQSGHHPGWIFG